MDNIVFIMYTLYKPNIDIHTILYRWTSDKMMSNPFNQSIIILHAIV